MSRLVEIAKNIGKFEIGAKEFPALRRMVTNSPRNLVKIQQDEDPIDVGNFFLRHGLTATEIYLVVNYLAQINSKSDNLEAVLGVASIVAAAEASKYLLNKGTRYAYDNWLEPLLRYLNVRPNLDYKNKGIQSTNDI